MAFPRNLVPVESLLSRKRPLFCLKPSEFSSNRPPFTRKLSPFFASPCLGARKITSRKDAKSRAGCENKVATKARETPCSAMASEARHRLGSAQSEQKAREVLQGKADEGLAPLSCLRRRRGAAASRRTTRFAPRKKIRVACSRDFRKNPLP